MIFKKKTLPYDLTSPQGQLIYYGIGTNNGNKKIAKYCVSIQEIDIRKERVEVLIWPNVTSQGVKKEAKKASMNILDLAKNLKMGVLYLTNPSVYKEKIIANLKPSETYLDNQCFY